MTRKLPLLLGLALASSSCRQEEVTRYRAPKSEESAPAMAAASAGTAVAAPESKPRGLRWTLPAGWKELPGDGMRLATLVPPNAGKIEITVVALPGESGGELANANRWRGQIGLPAVDEAGMAASRGRLNSKAGPITLYDFISDGQKKTRLVAGVAHAGGSTWFFKLMGDAQAAAAVLPAYKTFLEGVSADAR